MATEATMLEMMPSSDQGEMKHQQTPKKKQKGGLITIPFIIANEAFEKVASFGLLPNMILYLLNEYRMGLTQGQNILYFWGAANNFMPLLGAFLSDSYLGRFLTIGLGSISSLLGMILIWLTAMIPQAKPGPCDSKTQVCKSTSPFQYFLLLSSYGLMSIGAGGVRPCSLAFGADQLDNPDNPKNDRALESFFGWYYASASLAAVIALTGIVYIQDHMGWKVGFGVPAILMFLSASLFFLASSLYVKQKVRMSLFTSYAQVIVVAYKNRKLALPPIHSNVWYNWKDSVRRCPTDRLRFLNKACIIRTPEDISPDGVALNMWKLCAVDQVEELKVLIRVLPLWSTGIMASIASNQGSFGLLQARSMDRHIGSFEIPAASFGMFMIITLFIWIMIYDRVVLPVASKIRGKTVHLGVKQRMGIGLVLFLMGTIYAALVENVRRRRAIRRGLLNNPEGVLNMSAMWLVPTGVLHGLGEAFNAIGQTEFYYTEFPKSMSSIGSALFGLGMGVANLLASLLLNSVNAITKRGGKESWVSTNINKGHYDRYYWIIAILSVMNLFYFVLCSWAYGACVERKIGFLKEDNCISEKELRKIDTVAVKDEEKTA